MRSEYCVLVLGLAVVAFAGCARSLPPPEQVDVRNVSALRTALGGGAAETSAPSGATAPAAEPTGWATLKGSFKIAGNPPPRSPVPVTKDHEVCAPGGKQVLDEKLVVDSSGGIKDVLLFLTTKYKAGDPKWEHADYASQRE